MYRFIFRIIPDRRVWHRVEKVHPGRAPLLPSADGGRCQAVCPTVRGNPADRRGRYISSRSRAIFIYSINVAVKCYWGRYMAVEKRTVLLADRWGVISRGYNRCDDVNAYQIFTWELSPNCRLHGNARSLDRFRYGGLRDGLQTGHSHVPGRGIDESQSETHDATGEWRKSRENGLWIFFFLPLPVYFIEVFRLLFVG